MKYNLEQLQSVIASIEELLARQEVRIDLSDIREIYRTAEEYAWQGDRLYFHPNNRTAALWVRAAFAYQMVLLRLGRDGYDELTRMKLRSEKFNPEIEDVQTLYALLLANYCLAYCLAGEAPKGSIISKSQGLLNRTKDPALNKWRATMFVVLAYRMYKSESLSIMQTKPAQTALQVFQEVPPGEILRPGLLLLARFLSGERNSEVCTSSGGPKGSFSVEDMFFYHSLS